MKGEWTTLVMSLKEIGIKVLTAVLVLAVVFTVCYYVSRQEGTVVVNIYDDSVPTLIVDAGHGGADGGATSISGVLESEINLEIVLKIEALASLYGVKTEFTRTTSDIDYPAGANTIRAKKVADTKSRVELVNSTPNAVFVSIHQNIYDNGNARGFEVLFADTEGSADFATAMQSTLVSALNPTSARSPSNISSDVYIMNHIQCPAILIECGFISNSEDEALLLSDSYQIKIAASVMSAYIGSIDTFTH